MKKIKHKSLIRPIDPRTEILIIGTFNPDTQGNEADFFYGRGRNFFWRLLPFVFDEPDLKGADKQKKLPVKQMFENIESEIVFQIKQRTGRWPKYQSEIHFYSEFEGHEPEKTEVHFFLKVEK